MNSHARDRLIPYSLTFTERKTTSLFCLVQTSRIYKRSDFYLRRNHFNFLFVSYVTPSAVQVLAQCLVKCITANIVNILGVEWKSTMRVFPVAILAPVFAQLIQTSDCNQNLGVRLVFGLSERLTKKWSHPMYYMLLDKCQNWHW